MRQRLVEECELLFARIGLLEPAADLGADVFGRDHRAQLIQRQAEQVAEARQFGDTLDVRLGVDTMLAELALGRARSKPSSS